MLSSYASLFAVWGEGECMHNSYQCWMHDDSSPLSFFPHTPWYRLYLGLSTKGLYPSGLPFFDITAWSFNKQRKKGA